MSNKPSISTPLKRARGLGAAHEGTHHFWVQRLTALSLIPLTLWFMISLISLIINPNGYAVPAWMHNPIHAILLAALIIALFWHAKLGVQTIIEDYVHCEGKKIFTLLLLNVLTYGFGAASLMAIIHFQVIYPSFPVKY